MAYFDQTRRASPGSMAAVIGVHAAIGALLIAGLTVSDIVATDDPIISTWDEKLPPPPPPPEAPPEIEPAPRDAATPPLYVPQPKLDIDPQPFEFDTTDLIPPPLPPRPQPGPRVTPGPVVTPAIPKLDPVAAAPRNDPGGWVTNADYRSDWIRRELTGTARFRLDIAASGKVTGCTITRSTGHEALDEATCRLVQRRARFQPARGSDGEPVAGSYSSAVLWQLPE